MPLFNVTMVLAKQVVDQVEARSAAEAKELVQSGHGERIEGKRARLRLLVMFDAERVGDA